MSRLDDARNLAEEARSIARCGEVRQKSVADALEALANAVIKLALEVEEARKKCNERLVGSL